MKVLVAHPGTQYSHQLVRQLEKLSLLYKFYTGFAISSESVIGKLIKLMPQFVYRKVSNRMLRGVPASRIKTFPFLEMRAVFSLSNAVRGEEIIFRRNRDFQEQIPDAEILQSDVVIGFDTSSWILADRCKRLGKKFILDVSIPHPITKANVYDRIASIFPQWGITLRNKSNELIELEQMEMELADQIVVASSFTQKSLIDNKIPADKVMLNPYGVDTHEFHPISKPENVQGPLLFVFVGLVDARKGVPMLLQAFHELGKTKATLTLIGPVSQTARALIQENYPQVIIKGKLSYGELKQQLPQFDVMVFPSFFEGFGLVVPEAMACGLPVITTSATCGPDVMEDGREGLLIEAGNTESLVKAICFFIENRGAYPEMSKNARATSLRHTWDNYGKRWERILSGGWQH